jgi:tetratricopeptide (TPR) repeat protein
MPRLVLVPFLAALLGVVAAPYVAHAHADAGTPVENQELRAVGGGKAALFDAKSKVSVLDFVRTAQDRSADALKAMAKCEKDLAGKPVRFVAILPGETPLEEAQAMAQASGVKMPLLLDEEERLYNKLGVRLHPVIFLVDARHKVADFEQYRQIDYCAVIAAHIRFLLGEIDQATLDKIVEPPKNTMPNEDPRDVGNRDVNLGRKQLEIKKYDKAIASANKALALGPNAGAYALLGDVARARQDCPGALQQYQRALKLDPAEKHAVAGKAACGGK